MFPGLRQLLRWFLLASLMLAAGGVAWAVPSACTALWANSGNNLVYFNSATSQWVTVAATPVGGNSLSGYEGDGALYFSAGVTVPMPMYKATFSNATGSITFATTGGGANISVPASFTYTRSNLTTGTQSINYLVGATLDRDTSSRRMFLLGSVNTAVNNVYVDDGSTSTQLVAIGLLDPENPTSTSWTTVYSSVVGSSVTYPLLNSSGDIFADQQTGDIWLVTNTNPIRVLKLALTYSGYTITSAQVVQTATVAVTAFQIASVAVHPKTGKVYIGGAGTSNITYELDDHTASPSISATLVDNTTPVNDAGNCVAPPDPPTITKSFNPTTATTPGTSTLNITISNPNKVPIFVTLPVTDTFATGMVVHPTPSLTGTCYSDGTPLASLPASTTITGTAGAGSAVIASGSLIPGGSSSGGSCSFSVRVSATLANLYNNTIPAGSLTTSAGTNTVAASASFQVQNLSLPNLPIITKSFNPVTSSSAVGTTTLTIVITNPNTSTNTLTSSLTDTLPTNLRITRPSLLSINCFSDGSPVTKPASTSATTATTRITILNGSAIPGGTTGGSCSFVVRVTGTVAAFSLNTIPAGSLTTVSGSNADAATASFYLRASDFSVEKSQRTGATGATTTSNIDVPSGATISYVINIRNGGGVEGTRTFTDTLPALITPVLSVSATPVGSAGCATSTAVVGGRTVVRGTVSSAAIDEGCDITVVARVSVTSVVSTATNTVGIYTVTGALDTNTTDNSSTVVLTIKPAAHLTVVKDDGVTTLVPGQTNNYTITVANLGPADADGAALKDPAATGLNCTSINCSASGGAVCPLPIQLFVSALQSATGIAIPTFPAGSTATFVLTCGVTATGLP
ncbi:MAG: DUF11 domain-containing protein [Ramlibacter sp.]|nr:DUF11 domain-containing protein [Ramlibacter sp.]